MKHIFSIIILILFSSNFIYPQKDSISKELSVIPDIKKVEFLLDNSEKFRKKGDSLSIWLAKEALTLSKNKKEEALSQYALGYALYSFNHYEEAIQAFKRALDIYKEEKDKKGTALCLNRIGNTYQLQNSLQKALNFYFDALYINKEIKNKKELGRTYSNLARIYRIQGNYKKALEYSLLSLDLYKKENYTEGIAWTALGTARLYKKIKNYEKAISYLDQSQKLYKKLKEREGNKTGILLCIKERAEIDRLKGNYDKSLELYTTVLESFIQSNNQYGEANTLLDIAKIYYAQGNFKQALSFLDKASSKKRFLSDSTYLSDIYQFQGISYAGLKRNRQAISKLTMALKEAKKIDLKENILSIYYDLSSIYSSSGQTDKALFYFKRYAKLKDSLFNDEITKLELQFEFDKKQEQKEALHQAELKAQQIVSYTSAIVSVLLFLLIIVVFRSYRQKQKSNRLLQNQNNEIRQQKEEIETQRDQVTMQRDEIIKQKNIITDSIQYASKIQSAALPQKNILNEILQDYFIYYVPKNIVSGDFYWVSCINNRIFIVAADCTGHGVPGAFMSILGISLLNEIINKNKTTSAADILFELRKNVIQSLHQQKKYGSPKDGMDIALCIINRETFEMDYAGANNPIYIIRKKELSELKPDKMPIGIYSKKTDSPFSQQSFQLKKDDLLYLFSDGYIDQFGGKEGQKLKQKAFKQLLVDISELSLKQQLEKVESFKKEWQGDYKQVDDILLMGIKI